MCIFLFQASDFFRSCVVSYDKVSGVPKNCSRKTKHLKRAFLVLGGLLVLPLIGPCACPPVCKNHLLLPFSLSPSSPPSVPSPLVTPVTMVTPHHPCCCCYCCLVQFKEDFNTRTKIVEGVG